MKPDIRIVKLVDCMIEPAYNMPNVDAQAEEEELPPNPSAEIPMTDPATVHCDDDVKVKFFYSDSDFSTISDLDKIVDLLIFVIGADIKRLSLRLHVD